MKKGLLWGDFLHTCWVTGNSLCGFCSLDAFSVDWLTLHSDAHARTGLWPPRSEAANSFVSPLIWNFPIEFHGQHSQYFGGDKKKAPLWICVVVGLSCEAFPPSVYVKTLSYVLSVVWAPKAMCCLCSYLSTASDYWIRIPYVKPNPSLLFKDTFY